MTVLLIQLFSETQHPFHETLDNKQYKLRLSKHTSTLNHSYGITLQLTGAPNHQRCMAVQYRLLDGVQVLQLHTPVRMAS